MVILGPQSLFVVCLGCLCLSRLSVLSLSSLYSSLLKTTATAAVLVGLRANGLYVFMGNSNKWQLGLINFLVIYPGLIRAQHQANPRESIVFILLLFMMS